MLSSKRKTIDDNNHTQETDSNESIVNFEEGKKQILKVLCGQSLPNELIGSAEELNSLKNNMLLTLKENENNSLVIMGPRGCGKTALLSIALNEVEFQMSKKFIKIRLDGLIHTNAREAILSMAKQLQLKLDIEEEEYSEEDEDENEEQNILSKNVPRNFSLFKALDYILNSMGQESTTEVNEKKKLLIILDNMDLFAQHPKQTLLYNLFDLVQKPTPLSLLVIGVTSKLDTLDLLEKRVKSRFSHRQILIQPPGTLDDYLKILRQALLIPTNQTIDRPSKVFRKESVTNLDKDILKYNESVERLIKNQSMETYVSIIFNYSNDVTTLYGLMHSTCLLNNFNLTPDSFKKIIDLTEIEVDTLPTSMHNLTELELGLIIAIQKLMMKEIYQFNFEMIFHEYTDSFKRRVGVQVGKAKSKVEAHKALDHLISLEFLQPIEKNLKPLRNYQFLRTDLTPEQIKSSILLHPKCPMYLSEWVKY